MTLDFWYRNIEAILFYVTIFTLILGVLVNILVVFRWSVSKRWYSEFYFKFALAFFRLLSAIAGVASKFAPMSPRNPPPARISKTTLILAGVGYFTWEFANLYADHKFKRSLADCESELDDARKKTEAAIYQIQRLSWLITHLRRFTSEKLQRVRRIIPRQTGSKTTISQTREALEPNNQIQLLLEWLASLFHLAAQKNYNQNFRVGLFVERDNYLEVVKAFDHNTRSHNPYTSYSNHIDRFSLENDKNPSIAVRSVLEARTIIIPDCAKSPDFEYYNEKQKSYLKSMAAFPLSDFRPDGINTARAALLVDTDVTNFFTPEDQEWLEILINEFVIRIDLEYAISVLLNQRES